MPKLWTTEELIIEVRRIGAFNDVESDGKADADIINVLDLVMMDELVPQLMTMQEEFLIRRHDITTTASQEFVDVPSRAVANTLRDIWMTDGNSTQGRPIPQINREQLPFYGDNPTDRPLFYMEGDHIVLVPRVVAGKILKLSYVFRPGQLVKSAGYRKVKALVGTDGVTLDSTIPTAWTTANIFDVHSAKSGADNRIFDYAAGTVSGTGITFSANIDGTVTNTFAVEGGDYVCLAETAAIPALPREMHPILAQAAACRLLESDGDAIALQIARQTLARQIKSFTVLAESRVDGKPHKMGNPNSFYRVQNTKGTW